VKRPDSVGVRIERQGAIAIVLLDRPPLNLLTQEIRRVLGDVFLALADDASVRAVVLAGASENFCGGADMKEFPLRFDSVVAREHGLNGQRMTLALLGFPQPTIAAIEGTCYGGGYELALSCDFRVAASSSRVGLPEIRRGVWPGTGGIPLLSRLIGPSAAKRFILEGEMISAEAARIAGMVDQLAERGRALETAVAWAGALSKGPAHAARTVKKLADEEWIASMRGYFRREIEAYVACYQSEDAREGNRAFFEKREPIWRHTFGEHS